jgi:hypothetical protein
VIDLTTARSVTRWRLADIAARTGLDPVIVDEVEFDLGWIYYWDSERHLRTGDFADAVVGNAAIVVDKEDGGLCSPPASIAKPEAVMEWYRRERDRTRAGATIGASSR